MAIKKLSLVKYAKEFWFTLSDFSQTRDVDGYSGEASVKSAIRTQVVKSDPDKYIAFRGELQIKNIAQENKNNPLFNEEDFKGTRQALIHFSMLEPLCQKFKVSNEYKVAFEEWLDDCTEFMEAEAEKTEETTAEAPTADSFTEARSVMIRQMRAELNKMYKSREVLERNIEKLQSSIALVESLEVKE